MATSILRADALYFGDNGRCFCGNHAGFTAKMTGRDLSGRKVHRVTAADIAEGQREGFTPACETCGHTVATR